MLGTVVKTLLRVWLPGELDIPKQALLLEPVLSTEACEVCTQQEAALAGFNLWCIY